MKVYALHKGWVQGEIDGIQINGQNYSAEDILATAKALADAERALSSANHIADAGKVEGDGWLQKASELYDRCKLWPETSAEGFTALLQLRNHVAEILPSAPSGGDRHGK